MFDNMNLNMKDKILSLNQCRKTPPMFALDGTGCQVFNSLGGKLRDMTEEFFCSGLGSICYHNKNQKSFLNLNFLFKFMFSFMFEPYLKREIEKRCFSS